MGDRELRFASFPAFDDDVPATFCPNPAESAPPSDVSWSAFVELLCNPCWEYAGPAPADVFGQREKFASAEDAFAFLMNQP
jgi:hypothetical protein